MFDIIEHRSANVTRFTSPVKRDVARLGFALFLARATPGVHKLSRAIEAVDLQRRSN